MAKGAHGLLAVPDKEISVRWIADNHDLITTVTALGTLAVWVVYLQVFVSSYRKQLRATLLVTRGAGSGLEARCFLSNMSSGPVYISSVVIRLETVEEILVRPVTDRIEVEGEPPSDPRQRTRQGPLDAGATRDIGSFDQLIGTASAALGNGEAAGKNTPIRSITIEVVGLYGSEDLPIGARRRFHVDVENGRAVIRAAEIRTEQIRSRRQRRKLLDDLEQDR